jgi:hypothetical protein
MITKNYFSNSDWNRLKNKYVLPEYRFQKKTSIWNLTSFFHLFQSIIDYSFKPRISFH